MPAHNKDGWTYAEPEYKDIPDRAFKALESFYLDLNGQWEIKTKGVWEIARRPADIPLI